MVLQIALWSSVFQLTCSIPLLYTSQKAASIAVSDKTLKCSLLLKSPLFPQISKKSPRKGDAAMIMGVTYASFCDFEKELCLKLEFNKYCLQLDNLNI